MKRIFSTTISLNGLHLWLFVFRIAVAGFMLTHGIPKIDMLRGENIQFANPFGIGAAASLALVVFAEVFCSILLALGLATRIALIPLIITMLVAIFSALAAAPIGKKELPYLFLLIFITLLITGPGKFSVDALISKRGRR